MVNLTKDEQGSLKTQKNPRAKIGILLIVIWCTIALLAISAVAFFVVVDSEEFWGQNELEGGISQGDLQIIKSEVIASSVNEIEIGWIKGRVDVYLSEDETIKVVQKAGVDLPPNKQMRISTVGETLQIFDPYSKGFDLFSFASVGFVFPGRIAHTYLEVYLPDRIYDRFALDAISSTVSCPDLKADYLRIETVSGDATIGGVFGQVSLETVSGNFKADALRAAGVEVEGVSGNVYLRGALGDIRADIISGDLTFLSSQMVKKLYVDSVSGNISLTIPENDGFVLNLDKVSGDFSSDFSTSQKDNMYLYKNGEAEYKVDTISSSMEIKRQD